MHLNVFADLFTNINWFTKEMWMAEKSVLCTPVALCLRACRSSFVHLKRNQQPSIRNSKWLWFFIFYLTRKGKIRHNSLIMLILIIIHPIIEKWHFESKLRSYFEATFQLNSCWLPVCWSLLHQVTPASTLCTSSSLGKSISCYFQQKR